MPSTSCPHHTFSPDSLSPLRTSLLSWYDASQRELPWRTLAATSGTKSGYAVWVSEVMLQQTQVATVIPYFNRWIEHWPTMEALAKATLEEVHQVWAGLGYYSRGRRLWEGAKKVTMEMEGELPSTAQGLAKLPGVGKYTAAAISSIAFKEPVGVVDGNVIRVFSRMRKIGADTSTNAVVDTFWKNANSLVDHNRPGDFNQALMELGATVCTPKNPLCQKCPVSEHCLALREVHQRKNENANLFANTKVKEEVTDLEDICSDCTLCLSEKYDESVGVRNYPRKAPKASAKEATSLVCLLFADTKTGKKKQGKEIRQFSLLQRSETGLLASLFEFPSIALPEDEKELTKKSVVSKVCSSFGLNPESLADVKRHGQYTHKFSHLHQTYKVWSACLGSDLEALTFDPLSHQQVVVRSSQEMLEACPVSTAMKKVFKVYENGPNGPNVNKRKRSEMEKDDGRQKSIKAFFAKKS